MIGAIRGRCLTVCLGHGAFEHATAESTLAMLEEAIKNYGKLVSIMTDHGSQFYVNASEAKKNEASNFEKRLIELGIHQSWRASSTYRLTASWRDCTGRSGASCPSLRQY